MKCLCVLVLCLSYFGCGLTNSPCPGVVDFIRDSNDETNVYGRITLHPFERVSALSLKIIFTVRGLQNDGYLGEFKASSDVLDRYNKGQTVHIQVHFPVRSQLPKLIELTVNDEIVCSGTEDQPSTVASNKVTLEQRYGYRRADDTQHLGLNSEAIDSDSFVPPPVEKFPVPVTRPEKPTAPLHTNPLRSRHSINNSFRKTEMATNDHECGVIAIDDAGVPLINNGNFYERGELPWLVAIYKSVNTNLNLICGGTLVSDRHVVTAAHCMKQSTLVPKSEIVVRVGVHSLNEWSDDFMTTRNLLAANIHEEYNPATLQNDILVLTLDKRIKFNRYSRPACLWSGDTELSHVVGATGVVAGWGLRAVGDTEKQFQPQMVRVPIVSTRECRASKAAFHDITNENTFCAGDRKGAGPCNGDSGSGLYLLEGGKWRLRGLVSLSLKRSGLGICNLDEYVVFTDTAQFLPWIRNILSANYYD